LKLYLTGYLLLAFAFIASAQQTAKLTGTVYDKQLKPLANVFVKVKETGVSTQTNNKGDYTIQIPANQNFTMQVSFFDAVIQKRIGEVEPNAVKGQNFVIDQTFSLGTVTASGEKGRERPSVIKIDPIKLERFATTGGFEQNLKVIGIGIGTGGGELSSGYNVRGGNFDENLVYINEIEIYRPFLVRSGQQEGLSVINSDLVDYVEFSAGGFQAQYGDKMSSVLDIKYRQPDSFAATMQVSLLGAQVHFEDISNDKRFTYLVGARFRTNQYLLGSLDVQGDYKPAFYDVQTLLKYRFKYNLSLSYLGTISQNKYVVAPQSRQTSFGNVNSALSLYVGFGGQELMQYTTMMNGLNLDFQPTKNVDLKLNLSAFNTTEREHFTVEGAYRLSELETNLGSDNFANEKQLLGFGYFIDHARNDLQAQVYSAAHRGKYFTKKSTIQWGVRYTHEIINDKLKEWRYNDSSEYNISTTYDTSLTNRVILDEFLKADIDLRSHRIMGFVQNTHRLNETYNVRATYGIRSNYWSYNQENVISPRLQFSFEPNKKFNDSLPSVGLDTLKKKDVLLKFAAGYYYQPPFYRELRNLQGELNPNLKAQKSIHFVAGTDINLMAWGRPFKFVGEAYYKHLDNLVPYVIDNVRIRYLAENSAQGYAAGIDTRLNGEFIEGIESWFNFSLMQTQERLYYTDNNGQEQLSEWLRRPTDQRVNFSILFQDELPQNPSYKMNLSLVYGTNVPFYFDAANREKPGFQIPAYRRVDIGFSKVLIDAKTENRPNWLKNANSLWVSLEVFNLLQVDNTISFLLVKDFQNNVFGVPNYLTGRRLNLRFILKI
jgi:hypothetical protein